MPSGRVVRVVQDRGFGFLRPDNKHADVFFHFRDWRGDLEFGPDLMERRVRFDLQEGPDGRVRAVDIREE